jgi:hypothetical protein
MISAGKVGDFAISGQPIAAARSLCSDSTGCADVCPDVSRYLVSPYRFMVELPRPSGGLLPSQASWRQGEKSPELAQFRDRRQTSAASRRRLETFEFCTRNACDEREGMRT